jgi:16S rRNA (cytidine1402-2'-O)-methyltransferase
MVRQGKLFLIPTVIAAETENLVLPPDLKTICDSIDYFLAENIRTARRCLSAMKISKPIQELNFQELNKKTSAEQINTLMQPIFQGKDIGVMSEAGCPGIADPGARAVAYAHAKGIEVIPLVGPSSIFLALMASGFSGQSFAFHGYLPIDKKEKQQAIRTLSENLRKSGQTQIFMETPYRNNPLLEDLIKVLGKNDLLCIAKNITGKDEMIKTQTIHSWSKNKPDLHKIPCIFLIGNH